MLLSHNFDLQDSKFPQLNREEFAKVFIDGFQEEKDITCSSIDNPHWMVEVLFPSDDFSADRIGQFCAKILEQKRRAQKPDNVKLPDILILGGKKTTPPLNTSPTSLQTGEWGVDVVETDSADGFLTALDWDNRIAQKPIESVFKIEIKGK